MTDIERVSVIAVLWTLWGTLHSLLVWPPLSAEISKRLRRLAGCQRLLYNSLAAATLAPIIALHILWRSGYVVNWSGPWLAIPAAADLLGLLLFYLGFRAYKMGDFFGLTAALAAMRGEKAKASATLSFGGVLKYLRHPWYSGTILFLWGHDLDACNLAASTVLTLYVLFGTWLEEKKLSAQFGEPYADYKRAVPAFIPWRLAWPRPLTKRGPSLPS